MKQTLPTAWTLWILAALSSLAACGDAGNATSDTTTFENVTRDETPGDVTQLAEEPGGGEGGGFLGGLFGGTGLGGGGATNVPQHGDPPLILRNTPGPYWVDSYEGNTGRIYYPTNAPGPLAGMSLCGGFLNSGIEMTDWGEFYASWGIVTIITWTGLLDTPSIRGWALADSIAELKSANSSVLSPLYQKMAGRYGTSGYSMGGGGSTVASQGDSSLMVSIGMAPWSPTGLGVRVPSLFMCGNVDAIAGCDHSDWAYSEMSETVPKMLVMVGASHLSWFSPSVDWGMGGAYGLAFAKMYLEGDMRWKATLLGLGADYVETNIR